MDRKEENRDAIRKHYAGVATESRSGCCGGGCCCGAASSLEDENIRLGYTEADLKDAPEASNMGLGCGNPVAIAGLREGETVLDLGSGGGFDCFLASRKVGGAGHVIGVDMTPDMIALARKNAREGGYANVDFRLGEIEHLPVADASVDVIISNCVVNLSQDKEQVFREAYRVLKAGGRLSVSDVVAIAEMPDEMRSDLNLIAGCVGGAERTEHIRAMIGRAGFKNIRITVKENSAEVIGSWSMGGIENYVASCMIEAVK